MKKSYNPFKMWGSYIGAIIYFIPYLLAITCNGGWSCLGYLIPYYPIFILVSYANIPSNQIVWFTLILITGFLGGWAINSLWRKFRK